MPTFTYKAKKGPEKLVDGIIDAPNMDGAVAQILRMGLTPLDVAPSDGKENKARRFLVTPVSPRLSVNFGSGIRRQDMAWFTRQMSDMTAAAVPLLRALEVIRRQIKRPAFYDVVDKIYGVVREGGSLSDGMARYPQVFPPYYVSMVRSGEFGGHLEQVLARLSEYLEKEQQMRARVRSSLAYPAVILLVGILTVFVLLTFVIPRLAVMYEDMGQALPLPTQILIAVSNFFAGFWWLIGLAVAALWIAAVQWTKTPAGRWNMDLFLSRLPFVSNFIRDVEVGRFSRSLGTMIATGVSMMSAMRSVGAIVQNAVFKEELRVLTQKVEDGSSLRVGLKNSVFFPDEAVQMISVGEETGKLDESLRRVAEIFENRADETGRMVVSIIGPMILIVVVAIIGFVVVALLLPILEMNLIVE